MFTGNGYSTSKNTNKLIKTFNVILLYFFIYIFGLINILLSYDILPSKYYYDSNVIRLYMKDVSSFIPHHSFQNIAFLYKMIGFSYSIDTMFSGIFTYSLAYLLLIMTLSFGKVSSNKFFIVFLLLWIFIFSIYLGQYSKEITVIILTTILIYFSKYNKKLYFIILILLIGFYAFYFRIYWIIVLYIVLIFYIFEKTKSIYRFLLTLFGVLLLFYIAHFKGVYLTDAREKVNLHRIDSTDAITIILNPLPNYNLLFDFINAIAIFFFLLCPLPLLMKLNIKYILYILWELFNFYLFIKVFIFYYKNKNYFQEKIKKRIEFSIYLIISFTITQSIFEPDYGSFLKHQTGIIPIYLFLISTYFYLKNKLRIRAN